MRNFIWLLLRSQQSVAFAAETITNSTMKLENLIFFPRVIHTQFECVPMRLFASRILKCSANERGGALKRRKKKILWLLFMKSWITIPTEWKFRSHLCLHMLDARRLHAVHWLTSSERTISTHCALCIVQCEHRISMLFVLSPMFRRDVQCSLRCATTIRFELREEEKRKQNTNNINFGKSSIFHCIWMLNCGCCSSPPFDLHRCKWAYLCDL